MTSDSGTGTEGPTTDSAPTTPGVDRRSLGKYELIRKIGAGGMGTVFLAVDSQLKRTVALKVLPRERTSNPTLVKRFQAEAQAAAQLKHDNIVTVYDAGNAEGHLYIALEYVEGTDVYDLVSRRGSLPVVRSIEIVKQVARALDHAHKQGIVHRDIKPSNLLLTKEGNVKLTDMGLARSIDETVETGITREGTTVGTVDYMAPEQARDSQSADIRSDIYSLGCTWYQMLTGSPPFPTGSVTNKLYAHVSKPRPDPREKNKLVPEGVVAVLHKMMARKPKDRQQSPAELLDELEHIDLRMNRDQALVLDALSDASEPDEAIPLKTIEPPLLPPTSTKNYRTTPTEARSAPETLPPRKLPPIVDPGSGIRRGASPKPAAAPPEPTPPPKRARDVSAAPPAVPPGSSPAWRFDWDSAKWYVLGGAAVAVLVVGGLIFSQFGSALDTSDVEAAKNPFAPRSAEPAPAEEEQTGSRRRTVRGSGAPGEDAAAKAAPAPAPADAQKEQPNVVDVRPPAPPPGDSKKAERIPIGRKGERELSPDWLAGVFDPAAPAPADLPTATVGRAGDQTSKYGSLNEALEDLPETGGIVELAGDGPFYLSPLRLENRKTIVITAAANSRPVVALVPLRDSEPAPVLQAAGSNLILSGIHLAFVARQIAGDRPQPLIDVQGGDLTVRGCSVTLHGTRGGRTTAFRVSGTIAGAYDRPHQEPRVLLDRVVVRGDNIAALELNLPAVDLLASNCLFATGAAPIARVTHTQREAKAAEPETPPSSAARTLRFFSCSASARRTMFELFPGIAPLQPPTTEIQVLNSLLASETGSNDGVFVSLADWLDENAGSGSASLVKNLSWSIEHSLVLGWKTLARKDLGRLRTVQDAAAWQQVWRRPTDLIQFQPLTWPGRTPENLASIDPGRLAETLPPAAGIKATDDGRPGCDLAALTIPAEELSRRAAAFAERPALPAAWIDGTGVESVREIDLDVPKTSDLGRIISGTDWPSGTVFVVSGTGTKTSGPIRVRDKSLRIEFAEGSRGKLTVQIVSSEPRAERVTGDDAFLSFAGGDLTLSHVHFKFQLSSRNTSTAWMMHVSDGNLEIRHSSLVGQLLDSPGFAGLIRWTRGEKPAAQPSPQAGQYQQYAYIADSCLLSRGVLVQAELRNRALRVENSLLVSLDRLFDVQFAGADPRLHGALDVAFSTLSAGREILSLRDIPAGQASADPFRVFLEQSVVAPPVTETATENPVVIGLAGGKLGDVPIEWWEEACGYSARIAPLMARAGDATGAAAQGAARNDWANAWGPAHVLRPLLDEDGVLLSKEPAKAIDLTAQEFRLLPNSKAATWTNDGAAIGANIDGIPSPVGAVAAKKPAAKRGKSETKKSTTPRPNF